MLHLYQVMFTRLEEGLVRRRRQPRPLAGAGNRRLRSRFDGVLADETPIMAVAVAANRGNIGVAAVDGPTNENTPVWLSTPAKEDTMAPSTLLRSNLDIPDETTSAEAAEAVDLLDRFQRTHPGDIGTVRLVADNSDLSVTIPGSALSHLVELLAHIANGNAVTIAPVHAELTTQQAADMLVVSRPYLIGLLEDGQIPHRRVGNRRRIRLTDLLAYMREDDRKRAEAAAELTAEAQRLNLDDE